MQIHGWNSDAKVYVLYEHDSICNEVQEQLKFTYSERSKMLVISTEQYNWEKAQKNFWKILYTHDSCTFLLKILKKNWVYTIALTTY